MSLPDRAPRALRSPEAASVGTKLHEPPLFACSFHALPNEPLDVAGFRLEPQSKVRWARRREMAATLVHEPRGCSRRPDVDEEVH